MFPVVQLRVWPGQVGAAHPCACCSASAVGRDLWPAALLVLSVCWVVGPPGRPLCKAGWARSRPGCPLSLPFWGAFGRLPRRGRWGAGISRLGSAGSLVPDFLRSEGLANHGRPWKCCAVQSPCPAAAHLFPLLVPRQGLCSVHLRGSTLGGTSPSAGAPHHTWPVLWALPP